MSSNLCVKKDISAMKNDSNSVKAVIGIAKSIDASKVILNHLN
jgi:hypothetical protein